MSKRASIKANRKTPKPKAELYAKNLQAYNQGGYIKSIQMI